MKKQSGAILNYKNMLVVKYASTDENRPWLNGMIVQPDGTTVASNGHVLATVTAQDEVKAEILPENIKPQKAKADELIALESAQQMEKELRQCKKNMPVERCFVRIAREGKTIQFQRPDLTGERIVNVRIQEEPPNSYMEVIPQVSEKTHAVVTIDAKYLRLLADTVQNFGSGYIKSVSIYVNKNDTSLAPVVAKARNTETGQDLTVVISPLRPDEMVWKR